MTHSKIRTDNGPEFINLKFNLWAEEHSIEFEHITPGKPPQNSYVECLKLCLIYIFGSLSEVDRVAKNFMEIYNAQPHMNH